MKKDSLATFDSVGLRGRGLLGNSLGMEAGRCNLPALPLFNFHFFYFSFFSFFLFLPSFLLSFLFFYFAFFPFLLFLVGTIFALPPPPPPCSSQWVHHHPLCCSPEHQYLPKGRNFYTCPVPQFVCLVTWFLQLPPRGCPLITWPWKPEGLVLLGPTERQFLAGYHPRALHR